MNCSPAIRRLLAWSVIIAGMAISRGGFLEDVVYNIDEAEYAVAADALKLGWLPGMDLLGTTKPPAIALLYGTLFEMFGRSMTVIHAAHLVLVILTGVVFVELAAALWGISAVLPSAILFWMAFNSFSLPSEIVALNVESPGIFFVLLGLLLAWKWPRSGWAAILAGATVGIAVLFRQSFLAFMVPLVIALWRDRRLCGRQLGLSVLGFLIPWLPVLSIYAGRGALAWAWDSWVRYPIDYAGDTGIGGFIEALYRNASEFAIQAFVPLGLAIYGGIMLLRRRRDGEVVFASALFGASFVALCSGSRFFGHYWIQFFPVLALLGTAAWLELSNGTARRRWLLYGIVALGTAVAALHFPTWRLWDDFAPPRGASEYRLGVEQLELTIADFFRENTSADETVVVWGYCPQIYYHARRLPGVRDFLCHYITGYSPGTFDPRFERSFRSSGHPMAEQIFIEDIENRRPKYIVDLVQIPEYYFPFTHYSLRQYSNLAEYLRLKYLPEFAIGDARIYRRRTTQDQWWPSSEDTR